eukprot:g801.t1
MTRGPIPRVMSTSTFPSFVRRHLYTLLYLVKDDPPDWTSTAWCLPRSPSPRVVSPPLDRYPSSSQATIGITAREVNRLGFLLKPAPRGGLTGTGSGSVPITGNIHGRGTEGGRKTISSCLRCFRASQDPVYEVGCADVAAGLKYSIRDTEPDNDSGPRPGRICGMTKGTLVQGEDSFPDKQLIIRECQDSCIYALAPLLRVKVTACSDCIIVVGPISGCAIVENCTRIRLIYACKSTFITTCHESVLHLASNRQPILFGDNRLLQLAPFNIEYEYLAAHLEVAGLPVSPNLWDKPNILNISKMHGRDSGSTSPETSRSADLSTMRSDSEFEPDNYLLEQSLSLEGLHLEHRRPHESLLLSPDQLLPFTVPFKGGGGPLAGGAPSSSQIPWVSRLGSGLGSGPPFALSMEYKEGLTARLKKISELQESVAKAIADLNHRRDIQVAIQNYFKEWLMKTGKIRQVYDLAKLEQQMISDSKNENPDSLILPKDNQN